MEQRGLPLARVLHQFRIPGRLVWAGLVALVLQLRTFYPPRDLDALGSVALRDGALSIAHWLAVVLVASKAGSARLERTGDHGVRRRPRPRADGLPGSRTGLERVALSSSPRRAHGSHRLPDPVRSAPVYRTADLPTPR